MTKLTHYKVLQLAENAEEKEIKEAFRRLSKQHHPDLHGGKEQNGDFQKTINAAYSVLSDPEKRKEYDQKLQQERILASWSKAKANQPTKEPMHRTPSHSTTVSSRKKSSDLEKAVMIGSGIGLLLVGLGLLLESDKKWDRNVQRYRGRDGRFR
jgi:DnaJ-class molecular chaperone